MGEKSEEVKNVLSMIMGKSGRHVTNSVIFEVGETAKSLGKWAFCTLLSHCHTSPSNLVGSVNYIYKGIKRIFVTLFCDAKNINAKMEV